ncbi:MAG: Xaa-Pro peptidase family protein [Bryobacteraceae bacterium]|jgi:Xaa-Pro aminopeptidase
MVHIRGAVAALALAACTLTAQIPQQEYQSRRESARKSLDGAVLVLFGRAAAEMEEHSPAVIQEPNFRYLTGWTKPGAILLLSPAREILFLPGHDPTREKYTGPQPAASDPDIRAVTGFEEVLPVEQFESQLAKALESNAHIAALLREPYVARLKSLAPLRELADAESKLGPQRAKKSVAEIELIRKSTDVGVEAHRAAWRRIAPGLFEYQVAATTTSLMLERGCEGNAYPPIVASGPNATALHYSENARLMQAGELVLMDVGSECAGYATDITRTVPVSGKFTPRQRELYEIVLGAQKAAITAVKPGVAMPQLNQIARDYLDGHGRDLSGGPLGQYLTHRISHGVGLEVHDPPSASSTEPLLAGMVITVEPGLYIPEEKLGIRIEDTLLVTEDGSRNLSGALPREAAEIERAMERQ